MSLCAFLDNNNNTCNDSVKGPFSFRSKLKKVSKNVKTTRTHGGRRGLNKAKFLQSAVGSKNSL